MAFLLHTTDDGRVPGNEYMPAEGLTPEIGMALTTSDGNLAIATGTELPKYISVCQRETACAAGELIPVIRVLPDMIYESVLNEDAADAVLGDKLSIADDGMTVTAAAGGAVEVVYMEDTTAGSMIRLRFVQSMEQTATTNLEGDTTDG